MQNRFMQIFLNMVCFEYPPYAISMILLWVSAIVILVSVVHKFAEYREKRKCQNIPMRKSNHIVETFSMACVIVVIFNLLQFRHIELASDLHTRWLAVFFGTMLSSAGTWLHLWSKRAIGLYWSNQIEVQNDHSLITTGPYAIVRHPMYASLILWLLGLCLMFLNYLAALVTMVIFVPMMLLRATAEDRLLRSVDKTAFAVYSRSVAQLVPRFGPMVSSVLRVSVIVMLAYSLFTREVGLTRFLVLVCAHLVTGVIIKTPKVSFSYINKSLLLLLIYIGSVFLPSVFWLFYVVLIFDIWGLFGNCPCMMMYQKYNRCPCFDFVKDCVYKP